MKTRSYTILATLAATLAGTLLCPQARAYLYPLSTDGSGSYNIDAVPADVTLNNPRLLGPLGTPPTGAQTVHAWVYKDRNQLLPAQPIQLGMPVPVIKIMKGTTVTVNFRNMLPGAGTPNNSHEGASIHWHGIELDNDSDGVGVTQPSIHPGESYTYRFQAPRPGLFWFHSHMIPGDTLFAGMYGILIVQDDCEASLISSQILPPYPSAIPATNSIAYTIPLAMSDIEWDTNSANTTFGQVGRVDLLNVNGGGFKSINQWIEDCGNNPDTAAICKGGAFPGETVLVNGANPDTMKGLVTWQVVAGQQIRLQLFDECLTRDFDLYMIDNHGTFYPLIRIGGQGGILNYARIEGDAPVVAPATKSTGNDFGWVTGYGQGHISISSGVRADASVCVPNQINNGVTSLTLWAYNNNANWPLQQATNPATGFVIPPMQAQNKQPVPLPGNQPAYKVNAKSYPIAYFNIVPGNPTPCDCNLCPASGITNNTELRAAIPACSPEMVLTNGSGTDTTNFFLPANAPGPPNAPNQTITLQKTTAGAGAGVASIDGVSLVGNNFMDGNSGGSDFADNYKILGPVPPTKWAKTDRYTTVGSLLVISIQNASGNMGETVAHPYHLHGFSMQPISVVDGSGEHFFNQNTKNFEFLDTIDVYVGQTYNFAVRIEDRNKICDSATPAGGPQLMPCANCQPPAPPASCPGGAIGRWLYHCHIAEHGVNGMIGEIIVLPNAQPLMVQQPPDASNNGVDVLATSGACSQIVADDFQWPNPGGPVSKVTIWGSWWNDIPDPNATFELKFWTDVPACNGTPSHPGWQAWEMMFPPGSYSSPGHVYATNSSGAFASEYFFSPCTAAYLPPGDTQVYQYDFPIPLGSSFYPLNVNGTNWLSVTAFVTVSNSLFGWKTSILGTGWNDDSSWSPQTWGPPWSELLYVAPHPYSTNAPPNNSMNQGFALYSYGIAPGTPVVGNATQGPIVLSAKQSGANIVITWSGGGVLLYSDSPTGPWNTVTDSTGSPYTTSPAAPQRYYRVVLH